MNEDELFEIVKKLLNVALERLQKKEIKKPTFHELTSEMFDILSDYNYGRKK